VLKDGNLCYSKKPGVAVAGAIEVKNISSCTIDEQDHIHIHAPHAKTRKPSDFKLKARHRGHIDASTQTLKRAAAAAHTTASKAYT
jgi:hypothetical protein